MTGDILHDHSKENELSSTEIGLLHIASKWKENAQSTLSVMKNIKHNLLKTNLAEDGLDMELSEGHKRKQKKVCHARNTCLKLE